MPASFKSPDPPGDYSSSVQKSGYTNPDYTELDALQDPPKRHIVPSAEPVRLRFELNPPAALRDGSFAFENLVPDTYTLLARPKSTAKAEAAKAEAAMKDAIRTEVVPAFFPSAVDRSQAEAITGVFEFPAARAGEWTAQVHSDWIRDQVRNRNVLRFGSAAFSVEHQDPEELKIQFLTPFNLSLPATVVLSDGSAPTRGVSVAVSFFP